MKRDSKNHRKKLNEEIRRDEEAKLIFGADALLPNPKGTDEELDKELEKKFILDFNINNPKPKFVALFIKPYLKKFPIDFYRHIYRLHGWAVSGENLYKRPGIIGKWTNEIIYLRFPAGTLKHLQTLNPANSLGMRPNKHFQWLTDIGEEQLHVFISDAIAIMEKSKYWDQFKRLFAKQFGAPYQTHLFDID